MYGNGLFEDTLLLSFKYGPTNALRYCDPPLNGDEPNAYVGPPPGVIIPEGESWNNGDDMGLAVDESLGDDDASFDELPGVRVYYY